MALRNWSREFRSFRKTLIKPNGENFDVALSAFLARQKKRLVKQSYFVGPRGNAAARRQHRLLRTKFLGILQGSSRRKRRIIQRPDALLFELRPNVLRDRICPVYQNRWIPISQRLKQKQYTQFIWKDISFAREPNHTMKSISSLAYGCATYADIQLDFLDSECDDVTPYIVLSLLMPYIPPVISGGRIANEVSEVISAVGIQSRLRIGTISRKRRDEDYFVSAFKMVNRAPPGTFGDEDHLIRPQIKELVADKFVDTINGWICEHDLALTNEAEGSFTRAIGEALDNAERHGDASDHVTEGDWAIAAFSRLMFDKESGAPLLRCSVGIVSVGDTIAESLKRAAPNVNREIEHYVKQHSSMLSPKERIDSLRTVMALQDGITCVSEASDNHRGGQGFMELIEVFAELGENGRTGHQSSFTIVSGKTCIRVTGEYRKGEKKNGERRELWFNSENDATLPPSRKHVMTLDDEFPGVILSACFTIDPEHLRKRIGSSNDGKSDG